MSPFHQVEASQASRSALGILMPPGARTLVILRPRSLDWDLVIVRPDGEPDHRTLFWEISCDEGAKLVTELRGNLEEWSQGGLGRVEPVPAPGGVGYHVRIGVGRFVLLTCDRVPGVPYKPAVFDSVSQALAAAERIAAVLCPIANAHQEIYFNTDNFRK
jgi:hypothetical protein